MQHCIVVHVCVVFLFVCVLDGVCVCCVLGNFLLQFLFSRTQLVQFVMQASMQVNVFMTLHG